MVTSFFGFGKGELNRVQNPGMSRLEDPVLCHERDFPFLILKMLVGTMEEKLAQIEQGLVQRFNISLRILFQVLQ